MRRNLWIRAVGLAAAGVAAGLRPARAADPVPSTAGYRSALLAADTPAADRDEAARRLAAGGTPADVAAVRDALRPGNAPAQTAAARAIAAATDPDPAWVDGLVALLGPNRSVSDAAVSGLAAYGPTPSGDRAWTALQQFANGSASPLARGPAVRAMAAFLNPPAAAFLVGAVGSANQTIQRSAAEALAEMSGEPERGQNAGLWQQWWAGHANESPVGWRAYLGGVRARAAGPARARQPQLLDEADQFLQDAYYRLSDAEKTSQLSRFLQARSAPIRATGAKLVGKEVGNRKLSDEVVRRTRGLVGDDDGEVRRAAVLAVNKLSDPASGPYLVAQLGRERDGPTLVLLAQTLDKLQDLDAAAPLADLLRDPRPAVATAAAKALAGLGPALRRQRPAAANNVGVALRQIVAGPTNGPAGADLHAAALAALGGLGDPQAFGLFRGLLFAQPAEPRDVRVAALIGFGTLADPRADAIVAEALKDDDAQVRLAAARALLTVGTVSELDQLAGLLNPQKETDPDVRTAAWQAMARRFDGGSIDLLQNWVGRFGDDPTHELEVQQDYGRALAAAKQPDAVAANDQQIAATLMQLKRYDEAVAALGRAVDFYRRQQQPVGENLVGQMLDALLAARRYRAAAEFAGGQIAADRGLNTVIGPKFLDEVDRLKRVEPPEATGDLIDAALSIPGLNRRYADELTRDRTP